MSETAFRNYLHKVEKAYQTGNATEHTYRSALQELIETLSPGITATNEPKRVKCGAPDFIITNKHTPLGYIETKDIGVSLDQTERTDQMKRYLGSLGNLILTDYTEFRWYVGGQHRLTARLTKAGGKNKWLPEPDGIEQVNKLFQGFLITQTPTVSNPKELAIRMATIAQLIKNAINGAFQSEDGAGSLHTQMEGFQQVLLPDLNSEQFADMYAQTICYGMFAARCNTKPNTQFTREHAVYDIAKTNPFLRKMFGYIAGPDLDERVVWAVDDLAEVLNRSDMETILRDFSSRIRQEDPVVHFYETFLAAYDPKMREARGVYYTPEPIVSYIVRSVDHILKNDFGLEDGLADSSMLKATSSDGKYSLESHKVQILDPATGTGTFLYGIINHIYETFKDNKGMWSNYVSQHLLPRLFGFELLMAPYAVAHMKLGLLLTETGYDFRSNERLGVYLTNTLEEGFEGGRLPFAEWLVEEAMAAGNVKYDAPIMVVMGNPPYSEHSANNGKWIRELLHSKRGNYFEVDGKPLGERNPKWLNDDYVKFIRFAQWRIEQTGYGILAFITNHGYLDNPTFRGMRQSLMQTFDDIYVLDLHGNAKKKERSPDGSNDENIFDIQQGVAIGIFVKKQRKPRVSELATVHHAHLWGEREVFKKVGQTQQLVSGKYHWLAENDIATTDWKRVEPELPFYLFRPQDIFLQMEYNAGWRITEIIPTNGVGMTTARDHVVIDYDKAPLLERAQTFKNSKNSDADLCKTLNIPMKIGWNIPNARRLIQKETDLEQYIKPILYRPFDERLIFYHDSLVWRTVRRVMHHMHDGDNLGLVTNRQVNGVFRHIFCTDRSISDCTVSLETRERSYLFPLYTYPDSQQKTLLDMEEPSTSPTGRRSNLSTEFITVLSEKLVLLFVPEGRGDLQNEYGPEDIFCYMYAVFHSPMYRVRYSEFLKVDFPRLPLTSNVDLFRELCQLGDKLIRLHLMKKSGIVTTIYPESGNNVVEKVDYTVLADNPEQGRVWINKTQYFDNVPPDVWECHIGSFQVCHKWLKDRKGRTLSFDDIKHYQRIVAALQETLHMMEEIDETIEMAGGWPIE